MTLTPVLLITIPVLGLTFLVVWALWHLIYDEKTIPAPGLTSKEVDMKELAEEVGYPHEEEPKITPATTRLHIPPTYFPPQTQDRTGYPLSGMGGGWGFPRRLMPKRHHRWPRLDSPRPKD